MARLFSCGFELNSITNGVEFTTVLGSPTISSSTFRSGAYALRISSLTSVTAMGFRYQYLSSASSPIFARFYVRFATLPSAENVIASFNNTNALTTPNVYISVDNTGVFRLYDEDGQITTGGPNSNGLSNPVSTGVWYRVETKLDQSGSSGTHTVEAKISIENTAGVVYATASNRAVGSGLINIHLGGNLAASAEAQTQGDWFFDDVAVNDSTGSFQTSYPGAGSIIHLKPSAAGDINTFAIQIGGTAGSGNNFTRVNEVPPDDATTYNGSAVLSQEDLFNCDNTPVGLTIADTINVVSVGIRMADLVSADATSAFKVEIEKTTAGTKSQSGNLVPNSTTWLTNAAAAPRNYPLITYQDPDSAVWTKTTLDSMQIGYLLTVTNVQTIAASNVWALVDYTPGTSWSIFGDQQFVS